ncbi:aspartyl/asparaginyl beta-hydroxylase domain-containing protein [Streptomyces sp. NPDC005760]|uniref:aspartyl/asparaginyl beta-hydroxylase domain-containing protein n=1 Tax=Streptomyces sp. NPDC005760 TaxID=3156718 RepID=UPI0034070472
MRTSLDSIADLPEAARLRLSFDPDKLQRDVDQLSERTRGAQRSVVGGGDLTPFTKIGWRFLALRSLGGDPDRTDAGGPGIEGFADTPWIRHTPYLAEVLASLPTELRSARLTSLAPGVTVPEHRDTPTGLPYGLIRVHVPIRTNLGAVLSIDEVEHRWQPGTLWYGDFSRLHSVTNTGDQARIHLVIDCSVSPELLSLFPEQFQSRVPMSEVAYSRPEIPLQAFELADFRCEVPVPPCMLRLDDQAVESAEPDLLAQVIEHEGTLVLKVSGGPSIALVHVGGGDFRFQGWTEERGVHLDFFGDSPRAVFYTRCGRRRQQITRTAALPQS